MKHFSARIRFAEFKHYYHTDNNVLKGYISFYSRFYEIDFDFEVENLNQLQKDYLLANFVEFLKPEPFGFWHSDKSTVKKLYNEAINLFSEKTKTKIKGVYNEN
jgi:hypothetical protein